MSLNVLVGGRDRKDVLAQRLKDLENTPRDELGNSGPIGMPGTVVYNKLRVENLAVRGTSREPNGIVAPGVFFNKSLESFADRPGNYNRHLLPWEAFYIISNAIADDSNPHLNEIFNDMQGEMEWLDLVIESLPKDLDKKPNQIVLHQHPRGLYGYGHLVTGSNYNFHAMTSTKKRTFNLNGLPLSEDISLLAVNDHNPSLFDYLIRFPPKTNLPGIDQWRLRLPNQSEGPRPMKLSFRNSKIILSTIGNYAHSRGVHDPDYKPEESK